MSLTCATLRRHPAGPEHWSVHERVSYVWMMKRWVPYPFQNNICSLPMEDQINCINGLIEAKVSLPRAIVWLRSPLTAGT